MKGSLQRTMNAIVAVAGVGLATLQFHAAAQVVPAKDPGPRGGSPSAGDPIAGLSDAETEYFYSAQTTFNEEENVAQGLGPRMNLDSCAGCHQYPAAGGSSPAVNPQASFNSKLGGTDTLPPFKSLLVFAGEAYNVEMGISNEVFETERDETPFGRSEGSWGSEGSRFKGSTNTPNQEPSEPFEPHEQRGRARMSQVTFRYVHGTLRRVLVAF
jgi:hypothetical protein